MATVKDIYNFIDGFAPFDTAEEWDNAGLLIGDADKKIEKILFALDITSDIIEQAAKQNVDLIITHHPIIFKPLYSVPKDSLVYKLIKNGLSIICAHTNYDIAVGGVNDILCDAVGFVSYTKCSDVPLNIGILEDGIPADKFASSIKELLGGTVRYNNGSNILNKIAVCSGSGSDYLTAARDIGCNALLTGDGSHHDFLDADEYGMSLICAGHFETEILAVKPLADRIKNKFGLDCVIAKESSPVITI
ncbi:MAG: Nif3-like dinuclear metal center hexameric protein [Oscillospiraceae bacterium]|nr:Nif3-like dinuclear metal center hexameric protein [Oscillospiraceae bacterium]